MKPEESDHEDTTMRAVYRHASERLDERPDPRVRRAVLAASVDAAHAPTTRVDNPFGRRRWPLSMAALLVVALMVGLVVDRAVDEAPDRIVPVGPGASASIASPAREADHAVEPRPTPEPKVAAVAAASVEPPPRAAPSGRRADRAASGDRPRQAPARASVVESPAAPQAGPLARASNVESSAPSQAPMGAADRLAATALEANPLVRAKALRSPAAAEPGTPEAWVERIVALREAGRVDEADRELDALRRRYPDFAIPQPALRPTGTR